MSELLDARLHVDRGAVRHPLLTGAVPRHSQTRSTRTPGKRPASLSRSPTSDVYTMSPRSAADAMTIASNVARHGLLPPAPCRLAGGRAGWGAVGRRGGCFSSESLRAAVGSGFHRSSFAADDDHHRAARAGFAAGEVAADSLRRSVAAVPVSVSVVPATISVVFVRKNAVSARRDGRPWLHELRPRTRRFVSSSQRCRPRLQEWRPSSRSRRPRVDRRRSRVRRTPFSSTATPSIGPRTAFLDTERAFLSRGTPFTSTSTASTRRDASFFVTGTACTVA